LVQGVCYLTSCTVRVSVVRYASLAHRTQLCAAAGPSSARRTGAPLHSGRGGRAGEAGGEEGDYRVAPVSGCLLPPWLCCGPHFGSIFSSWSSFSRVVVVVVVAMLSLLRRPRPVVFESGVSLKNRPAGMLGLGRARFRRLTRMGKRGGGYTHACKSRGNTTRAPG